MITFKNELDFKHFFLSHLLLLRGSIFRTVIICSLVLLISSSILSGLYLDSSWFLVLIGVVLGILFIAPLFNHIWVAYYHRAKFIEYFYKTNEFGWEVKKQKITIPIEQIKKITIGKFYITNQLEKGCVNFIGNEQMIKTTGEKLANSPYKKFIG